MKKTMIIALLAVLVLGAFTACNGDVNAELAGGKRVIYLDISDYGDYWSFDGNGLQKKTVEVPSGCNNWGELAENGLTITVYNSFYEPAQEYKLTLKKFNERNQVYFYEEEETYPSFGINPTAKTSYIYIDSVGCDVDIIENATYEIQAAYYN